MQEFDYDPLIDYPFYQTPVGLPKDWNYIQAVQEHERFVAEQHQRVEVISKVLKQYPEVLGTDCSAPSIHSIGNWFVNLTRDFGSDDNGLPMNITRVVAKDLSALLTQCVLNKCPDVSWQLCTDEANEELFHRSVLCNFPRKPDLVLSPYLEIIKHAIRVLDGTANSQFLLNFQTYMIGWGRPHGCD